MIRGLTSFVTYSRPSKENISTIGVRTDQPTDGDAPICLISSREKNIRKSAPFDVW